MRAVRTLLLTVTIAVAGTAVPAAAAEGGQVLDVRLTGDQPVVTIDRDAPQDQAVAYEVVVTNDGEGVAPGVVVEARVPGGPVTRTAGDLAPGEQWRTVVTATIPATTRGGPLESVAVVRASDGREVASAPVRTDVQVISSAVYDRDGGTVTTVVPTQVRGATYERPAAQPDPLPVMLARTGAPGVAFGALAALGVALVLFGGLLVRRSAGDG